MCPCTVALVAFYWNGDVINDRLAVTGELALCGRLSRVGGLRGKVLGAFAELATTRDAILVLPADNTWKGVVVEYPSPIDASAARTVSPPASCSRKGGGGGGGANRPNG